MEWYFAILLMFGLLIVLMAIALLAFGRAPLRVYTSEDGTSFTVDLLSFLGVIGGLLGGEERATGDIAGFADEYVWPVGALQVDQSLARARRSIARGAGGQNVAAGA